MFRHSGWAVRRKQTYQAMCRLHLPERRIDGFCNCGANLRPMISADGKEIRLCCWRCRDRCCIPCGTDRARTFQANLCTHLDGLPATRFITLTLRHSRTSLADQLDRLHRSFATLRRREQWRNHVTGGVAFIEVKIGDDALWHPHLHVLVSGTWWEHKEISMEWLAVTGDSSIVHVRKVDDNDAQSRYITKYVTKPLDATLWADTEKLDEAISSLKGRRLAFTFGTWRGLRLDADPPDDADWHELPPVETLRLRAQQHEPDALRHMQALSRRYPLFATLFAIPPPGQARDDVPFDCDCCRPPPSDIGDDSNSALHAAPPAAGHG